MCPLCLTSLAVTVATTTGIGASAVAVATRVAKSLGRSQAPDADALISPICEDRTEEAAGAR
jgi:hypothetical protein